MSSKTRVEKTGERQIPSPEQGKSPIIPTRQKTVLEKNGVYQRPFKTLERRGVIQTLNHPVELGPKPDSSINLEELMAAGVQISDLKLQAEFLRPKSFRTCDYPTRSGF